MILPTKKLRSENSLVFLGGQVLRILDRPKTVSLTWEEFQKRRREDLGLDTCDVSFDWFVLSLDFLNAMGAIDLKGGRLERNL